MKANQTVKLKTANSAYAKTVGMLIALMVTIIVAILVYWNISGGITQMQDDYTERFTGYTALTANASAWSLDLQLPVDGSGNANVTCYNSTTETESYPTFTLDHDTIAVGADAADYFDQVNVTYTSRAAQGRSNTDTQTTTVFNVLPIIAIVVIGGILIGLVIAFGGRRP